MKKILPLLAMAYCLNANAQSATFQNVYGGTGIKQDYAYDMHKTSDGGYVLGGVTENYPTGIRRSYVIKTDANGDTLWTSIYGDTCRGSNAQQYINDICQSGDGGYLGVGGMIVCGGITTEGGEITRLDLNGNVLWSKTCTHGSPDPYPVIQCSDGNFIFGGMVTGVGAGLTDAFLTKIDINGDTLWSRTYGSPGNEWFYHILQTPDGGYLAAGYSDGFSLGVIDTNRNIYLVKTDSNGNLQWSKTYGTHTGNQQCFGHCLQPTTDGGYIVTGQAGGYFPCCANVESDSGIFLMKIDASGNMKWAKYFSGEFGHAVKQTADKGYIIAGSGNYGDSTGDDVVLIKTDSLGILQWSRTYGGSGNEDGWLLDIANDGGYLTGGWTESFGNLAEHIYFVKTDTNGNSPCNENVTPGVAESVAKFAVSNPATQVMIGPVTTTFVPLFQRASTIINLCSTVGINQVKNSNEQVNIYPNPSNGNIQVTSSENIDDIQITDLIGRLVYEAKPNNMGAVLHLDNAGMYFITLTSGTTTNTKKVIIIK
ncbi:MAG: T9SS type A sorting domain-containing protein [Bacteroidia bacterium]